MYKRILGSNFTIKNPEEKEELIKIINDSKKIKFMKCIGITPERFTGKILNVLFKMEGKGRIVSFEASGEFPVLKLTRRDSNNVYIIEVPTEPQIEKKVSPPKVQKVEVADESKIVDKTTVEKFGNVLPEKTETEKKSKKKKENPNSAGVLSN